MLVGETLRLHHHHRRHDRQHLGETKLANSFGSPIASLRTPPLRHSEREYANPFSAVCVNDTMEPTV